ncbi:hypothetical protein JCM6882_004940 [Rhodosporidiobolus microsporus]
MANKTYARRRSSTRDHDDEDDSGEGTDYDAAPAATADKRKSKKKAATQSKGKKRRTQESEDDEMDVDSDEEDEDDGGKGKGKKELTDDEKKHYIQLFVRYVLFHESHERRPLKREDVVKNVLTDGRGRHFNALFPKVQKVLKEVMGMELVALRAKEGGKAQAKSWVLRSLLPPPLIRYSTTHPLPSLATSSTYATTSGAGGKKRSLADALAAYEADEDLLPGDVGGENGAVDEGEEAGVMRDVKREEGAAYGVLGVVLALILVNGKVLADDQLISYLRRLSLSPSSLIPYTIAFPSSSITSSTSSSSASTGGGASASTTLSGFLNLLTRQGYLERGKTGQAGPGGATQGGASGKGGKSQGPSRTQRSSKDGKGVTENGDPSVEWRWGARSEVEFGELGVARFVERVFRAQDVERSAAGGEADGSQSQSQGGGKRGKTGEKFLVEVARAAGVKELRSADDQARAADE